MRVNSAFTGFFINRLVMTSGIAIVLLAIFFIIPSFKDPSIRDLLQKQVNLVIRQIGDRLLLQAGDSTSRVMPVTESKEGNFLLTFEKELVFNHDSLLMMVHSLLPKTQFPSGYTVTVHDCVKGDIVYGFQINNTTPDILACSGRKQPQGCYTIEFAFPDFYENVNNDKQSESVKADPPKVNSNLEELKTTGLDYDINKGTEKLKSVKNDSQESKTTIFGYPLINVVYIGLLVLFGVTLLIRRSGKILHPVPAIQDQRKTIVQDQDQAIIKEPVAELPALGRFLFDVKGQRLLLGTEVISLTDKECKVLELLHKNFGELLPRETLMQEVWINEGVITGRSLDMFVSKLRKILSRDPDLRIANIHGKGYSLQINASDQ